MKKLLLIFSLLFAFSMQGQVDFWTEYATSQPAASTGMRSISIVDDNIVWISPSCGTTGCTPIRRYAKSIDGGLTWTTGVVDLGATSANLEIANIHGVDANIAFAAVFPRATNPGGIWKTINGGTTWVKQTTALFNDAASFTNLVYFWDANNGVCMGDAAGGYFEIYTTTNGGTNWTRTPSSPALIPVGAEDYGLTNKFSVTGESIWIGTTFGRILKSTDRGLTWTVVQSPIPDFGGGINGSESGDLSFSDETNGILTTSDYLVYSTADGGATWTDVAWSGAFRNFGCAPIPGLANTYVTVGEDVDLAERGSSFTTDGGLNWTSINNNPDVEFVQGGVVSFLNANTGFASGFSTSAAVGGIYKWNGDALATSTFSSGVAITASPNPTSGITELVSKNIAQVSVTDILGKVVYNNSFNSLSNVSLDLSNFNTGVYMVKVTNDTNETATLKVVKQ